MRKMMVLVAALVCLLGTAAPRAFSGNQSSGPESFTFTDELTVQIPALPRPTLSELRAVHPWIREKDGILRDTSSTEAVTLRLATILKDGEERVNGPEYEIRIAPGQDLVLGYSQAKWLVEHQKEFPKLAALLGKIYVDFPGLVVVSVRGHRSFPYLDRHGTRWYLSWNWISDGFNRHGRVAVSSK